MAPFFRVRPVPLVNTVLPPVPASPGFDTAVTSACLVVLRNASPVVDRGLLPVSPTKTDKKIPGVAFLCIFVGLGLLGLVLG